MIMMMTHRFSLKRAICLLSIAILVQILLININCAKGKIPFQMDEEDDEEYFTTYIEDLFLTSTYQGIDRPLQTYCLPVQTDLPDLTSQILIKLEADIAIGGRHGQKLARGLLKAVHFDEVLYGYHNPSGPSELARMLNNRQISSYNVVPLPQGLSTRQRFSQLKAQAKRIPASARRRIQEAPSLSTFFGFNNVPVNSRASTKSKNIDYFKMKNKIVRAVARLPPIEVDYLEKAIQEAYGSDAFTGKINLFRRKRSFGAAVAKVFVQSTEKVTEIGARPFMGLLTQIGRFGIKIFDHLYLSPEFLLNIPIIGEKIIMLRRKGQALYKMIEFVRRVHHLYMVSKCPKLDSQSNSPKDPNSCDDDKEINPLEVEEVKQIVSEAGSKALTKIVFNISNQMNIPIDEQNAHELISRSTYAVLSYVLPQSCPTNENVAPLQ